MLQPKRSKYRKEFRGKNRGRAQRGNEVTYGDFGLMAETHGEFSARQIEATRKVLARSTKRAGQVWIMVFPDHPITQKAPGVKMGSGKGDIKEYVCKIQPGRILFELGGVPEDVAREAFRKAGHKIPMKTKFVYRTPGTVSSVVVHHHEEEETAPAEAETAPVEQATQEAAQ